MKIAPRYYKYTGLLIVFALTLLTIVFKRPASYYTVNHVIAGECIVWTFFIVLILIAKFGEKDPIRFTRNGMSVLKSIGLTALIMISMLAIGLIFMVFYKYILHQQPQKEELSSAFHKLPVWLKMLLAIRAGVIEETFFRAYAITRIKQLTNSNFLAFAVPLIFFSAGHYAYGTLNHVVGALLLGLVLAIYYIKTRNLVANIFAHSLYDAMGMIGT